MTGPNSIQQFDRVFRAVSDAGSGSASKPRAKLLRDRPGIVMTSRGWQYPDGTFKPFRVDAKPILPMHKTWLQRMLGR